MCFTMNGIGCDVRFEQYRAVGLDSCDTEIEGSGGTKLIASDMELRDIGF